MNLSLELVLTHIGIAIVSSVITYFVTKRKRWFLRNFNISISKSTMTIDNASVPALELKLINNTHFKIFITHMRIKNNKDNFNIYKPSTNDLGTGYYELLFLDKTATKYDYPDILLNTNEKTQTAIGLENDLSDEILQYRPKFLSRLFGSPNFFVLQYTALVGDKIYRVKTVF